LSKNTFRDEIGFGCNRHAMEARERQRRAERGSAAQKIAAVDRDAVHANLRGPALTDAIPAPAGED
jgi:hypothetical protein